MDAFVYNVSPHPSNIQTEYQVGVEAKSEESFLIEDLCLGCRPSFSVAPHRSINLYCMFLCTVIIIPRFSLNENIDFWFF